MTGAAFTPSYIAALRASHDGTLTMLCDVRRSGDTEVDGYGQDTTPLPHLTDVRCTFLRVARGFNRTEPDRVQSSAEPEVYLPWDCAVTIHDEVGNIRDENGITLMAGYLAIKTVNVGQFSVTAVLREVTV